MVKMTRRYFGACILGLVLTAGVGEVEGGEGLREEAMGAMERAARFFREEVSTQGGYLWQYRNDLAMREGEGLATASMIWVQPPGTPSVGMAFLRAYERTGDKYYLDAAREAVLAQAQAEGSDLAFRPLARNASCPCPKCRVRQGVAVA